MHPTHRCSATLHGCSLRPTFFRNTSRISSFGRTATGKTSLHHQSLLPTFHACPNEAAATFHHDAERLTLNMASNTILRPRDEKPDQPTSVVGPLQTLAISTIDHWNIARVAKTNGLTRTGPKFSCMSWLTARGRNSLAAAKLKVIGCCVQEESNIPIMPLMP